MGDTFEILTHFRLHQRTYESAVTASRIELGLAENSWVWQAFEHEATRSRVRRCQKSEIQSVIEIYTRLRARAGWLQIANKAPHMVDIRLVVESFALLETEILGVETWGNLSRGNVSRHCRGLLRRFVEAIRLPMASRLSVYFKTSIPKNRHKSNRKLISDQPIHEPDGSTPPIGALPHRNIKELEAATTKALLDVLDRISSACRAELELLEKASRTYERLLQEANKPTVNRLVRELRARRTPSTWLTSLPIAELAKGYLVVVNEVPEVIEARKRQGRAPRSTDAIAYIADQMGVTWNSQFLPYFPLGIPLESLVACVLGSSQKTENKAR